MADEGVTALHLSAHGGHHAVSKMLVKAGANVEAATTEGLTPLWLRGKGIRG